MATEVDIANKALRMIGAREITGFDEENSEVARLVKTTYWDILDAALEAHSWNFAMRRETLAADTSAPEWEFTKQYTLPVKPHFCLRVVRVNNEDEGTGRWKVEGRKVVTRLGDSIEILYVERTTDSGNYSPLFIEALAAKLAAEWALPITGNQSITNTMTVLFRDKIAEARSMDSAVGIPDALNASEWLDARW